MATLTELARLIDLHLYDLRDPEPNWAIAPSKVAGRGVFATRDIQQGETIFRERALVVGPTARKGSILNTCVCCHKLLAVKDFLCKNKCTLPVCDKCADSPEHHNECQLFQRWQPMDMKQIKANQNSNTENANNVNGNSNDIIKSKLGSKKNGKPGAPTNGSAVEVCDKSLQQAEEEHENYNSLVNTTTLRLLTAVRAFFLNDSQRALVNVMQANNDRFYRREIIKAAQCFRKFPTTDKIFMDRLFRIVAVCNTNAFETPCTVGDKEIFLRGLFPLTAIMNHECTPNACHYFVETDTVVVKAARFIAKGCEITTTYAKILWSNLTRCTFLKMTKSFICNCVRCNDNTEYGTYLSALFCRKENCPGIVIPIQVKTIQPDWHCLTCESIFAHSKMTCYQDFILNTINNRINVSSVSDMITFINDVCPKFCPSSNYVLIEAKLNVIWRMSKVSSTEYSEEQLQTRDQFKEEILSLLDKLGAADCTLKKLLTEEIK